MSPFWAKQLFGPSIRSTIRQVKNSPQLDRIRQEHVLCFLFERGGTDLWFLFLAMSQCPRNNVLVHVIARGCMYATSALGVYSPWEHVEVPGGTVCVSRLTSRCTWAKHILCLIIIHHVAKHISCLIITHHGSHKSCFVEGKITYSLFWHWGCVNTPRSQNGYATSIALFGA